LYRPSNIDHILTPLDIHTVGANSTSQFTSLHKELVTMCIQRIVIHMILTCMMASFNVTHSYPREKRSMSNFLNLIYQTGSCSTGFYFRLQAHGNYCGITTNSGKNHRDAPTDGLDKCCFHHDNCYGKAEQRSGCDIWSVSYSWSGDRAHNIKCGGKVGGCPRNACECDKIFATCVEKEATQNGCSIDTSYTNATWGLLKNVGKWWRQVDDSD